MKILLLRKPAQLIFIDIHITYQISTANIGRKVSQINIEVHAHNKARYSIPRKLTIPMVAKGNLQLSQRQLSSNHCT